MPLLCLEASLVCSAAYRCRKAARWSRLYGNHEAREREFAREEKEKKRKIQKEGREKGGRKKMLEERMNRKKNEKGKVKKLK